MFENVECLEFCGVVSVCLSVCLVMFKSFCLSCFCKEYYLLILEYEIKCLRLKVIIMLEMLVGINFNLLLN